MNKFNLEFSGEIVTGYNPADVKRDFGRLFSIDDPARVDRFFSGQTVILRRNLERKDAADYFHQLKLLGAVAALVKVSDEDARTADPHPRVKMKKTGPRRARTAINGEKKPTGPAAPPNPADQVWAVSSRLTRKQDAGGKRNGEAAAHTPAASGRKSTLDISARVKARKEESRRRADAGAARTEAEAEQRREQQKQAKAERAREKAEEAARLKAAREEQQRREAEEAARLKAEREEQQRREAEREEQQRREAEEAARLKAEREERQRREAEEAARLKAEREERQRREAEKAARREAEKAARRRAEAEYRRLESEEADRLHAELEAIKRQEQTAIRQALSTSLNRQQQAERESAERLQAARSRLLREPSPREAEEAQPPPLQLRHPPAREEADSRPAPTRDSEREVPTGRKRQRGEPNLYQLRPFRNSAEVRGRCEHARRMKRRYAILGVIGLALTLVTAQQVFRAVREPVNTGVTAVATDPGSGPVLLFSDTLISHDRAGIATGGTTLAELGLQSLSPPLAFDDQGALIAVGEFSPDAETPGSAGEVLLRCDLEASSCRTLSTEVGTGVHSFVINAIDGSVIAANDSGLVKIGPDGTLTATAEVALPAEPVLRLHAGLLFVNSADGPGISVLRYEDAAFGQQLDEVLLLPGAAAEAGRSRVGDFIWSAGAWWVSLYNPDNGSIGVYRFDEEWSSLGQVALTVSSGPLQLANWGQKTLVNDLRSKALQRFNAQGIAEVPFESSLLAAASRHRMQGAQLERIAWRAGLLAAGLLTVSALVLGLLQDLRQRVYKPRRESGAEPIDDKTHLIQWLDPIPDRSSLLRYRTVSYCVAGIAVLLLAIAASVSVWQLAALLVALAGPLIALFLFSRQSIGHIGTLGDRLLLVDHSGMYHIARGSGVQHCGAYLLIDDVVVFCGSTLFPAFLPAGVHERLASARAGGVKVDRKTVMIKLLQSRHPLALGGCAVLLCSAAAIVLLFLQAVIR